MFGKKRLTKLDIKSIVLMLDDYNRKYPNATNRQKEYFLATTLEEFGIKTDSEYGYGCIPPPPDLNGCYQPIRDVTTAPPTGD